MSVKYVQSLYFVVSLVFIVSLMGYSEMFCQLLVYNDTKLIDFWVLEQNEIQYW